MLTQLTPPAPGSSSGCLWVPHPFQLHPGALGSGHVAQQAKLWELQGPGKAIAVSVPNNGPEKLEFHESGKRENPLATHSESEKKVVHPHGSNLFHMACWILDASPPPPPQVEIGCDELTPGHWSFQPATGHVQDSTSQGSLTQRADCRPYLPWSCTVAIKYDHGQYIISHNLSSVKRWKFQVHAK